MMLIEWDKKTEKQTVSEKMNQSERGTVSNKKTEEDVEQVRDGECKLKPFVGA